MVGKRVPIQGPIFIGRSWEEYLKMFDLNVNKLQNKSILDCAAGASSFTQYLSKKGLDSMAVDILYGEDPLFLQRMCEEHLQALVNALEKIKGEFTWDFFKDLNELKSHRMKACNDFTNDYMLSKGKKYIMADLTDLPFIKNSFDMVLCAHLLFIYDHKLDWKFHKRVVEELIRVTRGEIRIYPLVKHKGQKSSFVEKIINEFSHENQINIVKVDYQFRKGGDEMLQIIKNGV